MYHPSNNRHQESTSITMGIDNIHTFQTRIREFKCVVNQGGVEISFYWIKNSIVNKIH